MTKPACVVERSKHRPLVIARLLGPVQSVRDYVQSRRHEQRTWTDQQFRILPLARKLPGKPMSDGVIEPRYGVFVIDLLAISLILDTKPPRCAVNSCEKQTNSYREKKINDFAE